MGDVLLGVRANDPRTDQSLRDALAPHVAAGVSAPYPNYSVRIEPPAPETMAQPLHALYEGGCLIVRSRHPEVVVGALLSHMSVPGLVERGAAPVRCTLFGRVDGRAVLASDVLRTQAARNASRLASQGLEFVPTPAVLIDGGSHEVLAPAPSLSVAVEALSTLTQPDSRQLDYVLAERRFQVHAWVFLSARGSFVPMSRASAVVLAAREAFAGVSITSGLVRSVARVMTTATPIAAGGLAAWDVLDQLPELFLME